MQKGDSVWIFDRRSIEEGIIQGKHPDLGDVWWVVVGKKGIPNPCIGSYVYKKPEDKIRLLNEIENCIRDLKIIARHISHNH